MFRIAWMFYCVLAVVLLTTSSMAVADTSTTMRKLSPSAQAERTTLPPPSIGTPENPFDNTCDGRSIGFLSPAGEAPRMRLGGAPAGSVYECRTEHATRIESRAFAPCDGRDGARAAHTPEFNREGSHRTEVRYRADGRLSETASVEYYVHHSLDGVACCRSERSDAEWFAAALEYIRSAEPFDGLTHIRNPFIKIVGLVGDDGHYPVEVLSLRRTFRYNSDQTLILTRRTMISRRTFEKTGERVCSGMSLYVPQYNVAKGRGYSCGGKYRERPYSGGVLGVGASCPDVYCTVTSCKEYADGCIRVTHTFNRGPGQDPWVADMPLKCPNRTLTSFEQNECDVYVINRRGHAVCLNQERDSIVARRVLREEERPLRVGIHPVGENECDADLKLVPGSVKLAPGAVKLAPGAVKLAPGSGEDYPDLRVVLSDSRVVLSDFQVVLSDFRVLSDRNPPWRGRAPCLKTERGSSATPRVVGEDHGPVGLRVLRGFRSSAAGGRYVFSAKSRRQTAEELGVLHLPD